MAVGLAWGSRTTGNPIRQHARLCRVFQKLSRGNKELPRKTRPPWMGGGRLGLGQNRGRNGQKGSQRHIRTTPSITCGLFCSGQSWADRSGASRNPASRHHAGLREGIRAWGGRGQLKITNRRQEKQRWRRQRTWWGLSQTKLKPEGLLHLHESQKSLTKSSKPEGSHSHFGNAKESNTQWPVCNPPITFIVVISSFTYTVFKELEKQSGMVTRERSERGKGNEVIIL